MFGCARGHEHQLQISGFEAQFSAFEAAGASVGKPISTDDLIITLDPSLASSYGATGMCYTRPDTTPNIHIDQGYWQHSTDTQKQILLFHEMGHCLLGRVHNNSLSNGMAVSIMYFASDMWTSGTAQQYYLDNRQSYVYELFH